VSQAHINRILQQFGELEGHEAGTNGTHRDYHDYAGRPVAFCEEVLAMRLLAWQKCWLDAFHSHTQHATRSANGCGKTGLAGPLLLYTALALHGTAIYFSASERQTRTQLKALLERLIRRVEGVPHDIYSYGVNFSNAGCVVLANAGDVNAMQGAHGETLVIVADEAQALSAEQLAALQGCTVSDDNWLVLMGNPLGIGTPFHRVCVTSDPSWHRSKVTALEVINDPEAVHIRGLITAKGINNLRQTWGEQSPVFQSRCMAEFPEQPADALFPEPAIAAAFARWHDPAFIQSQQCEGLTLGVDVGASTDGDASAMAVAKGGWVRELVIWWEQDTMRSVGRVIGEFRRLRVAKVRGSAYEERETAILQNRIGAMFVDAALAMGDPGSSAGSTARSTWTRSGSAKASAIAYASRCIPATRSQPPAARRVTGTRNCTPTCGRRPTRGSGRN
jgi:hypothetical protein